MPVATSTMIQNKFSPNSGSVSSLKFPANKTVSSSIDPGIPSKDSFSKHKRALEKIYNRAARAFLNRNVLLTQELLETGFRSLESVALSVSVLRKWDILRITFDTMMYSSPPATSNQYSNNLLTKSPHSFVNNMYNRSVQLFQRTEDITILPSQVLSTLVYSSLKIDAPDVGRRMIEDWLAGRGNATEMSLSWMSSSSASSSVLDGYDADASVNGDSPMVGPDSIERGDGYPKILELYCLQVLPRLGQWEYAADFLEYESELDVDTRDSIRRSLQGLHAQAISSRLPSSSSGLSFDSSYPSSLKPPSSATERAYSPAPSTSSSSSSLSTTSTHTVVPATPRARVTNHTPSGLSALSANDTFDESGIDGSEGTITPRQRSNTRSHPGLGTSPKGKGKQRVKNTPPTSTPPSSGFGSGVNVHPLNPNGLTPLSLPRTHLDPSSSSSQRRQNPTTLALIKASVKPYLVRITGASSASKIASLVVIFMIVPILSLLLRMLRRRQRLPVASGFGAGGGADLVRQRLQAVNANANAMGALGKLLASAWFDIIRIVLDTVKMGGSGLV